MGAFGGGSFIHSETILSSSATLRICFISRSAASRTLRFASPLAPSASRAAMSRLERAHLILDTQLAVAAEIARELRDAAYRASIELARERGRLPLEVMTFDEEAIHPETVEYIARVAALPDVRFRWYCLPIQHRNACSRRQPYWHPSWIEPDPHYRAIRREHTKRAVQLAHELGAPQIELGEVVPEDSFPGPHRPV